MNNVLEYLENATEHDPDKIAVEYREDSYSYLELTALSKKIGSVLKTNSITKHSIGVIANRSITTLAFFFGVLYSGNYYVPIDPEMKKEKIESILEDADITILLEDDKESKVVENVEFQGQYFTINDFEKTEVSDIEIPEIGGDDPLYMVYTSGSTGKPKGVLKSHKAVISYIEAYVDTFHFSEDEIIGNQTPFFFDASAKDIYLMLKLGCKMEILPSSLFTLPPELIDYLNEKKVTFASWVPTVLSLVAQLNPFSMVKPETLKKIFFVGEVMPMKHLNTWRKSLPEIEYVNLYGSSEIAGISCYYKVTDECENYDTLPMGKPLNNCKIYLIDGENIVSEANHIGEIYVVSDALALEYYNDPEKTKECFQMRDFGEGIVRCFKTGDLAQYDENGNLIFASRNDSQIKHMGRRIELGEIEVAAGNLDEIDRCCCLYNTAKKKITLFCEVKSGIEITAKEIRSILRQKLSSYMVPAKVIILEKLPINQNGKIHRQLLKEMMK